MKLMIYQVECGCYCRLCPQFTKRTITGYSTSSTRNRFYYKSLRTKKCYDVDEPDMAANIAVTIANYRYFSKDDPNKHLPNGTEERHVVEDPKVMANIAVSAALIHDRGRELKKYAISRCLL